MLSFVFSVYATSAQTSLTAALFTLVCFKYYAAKIESETLLMVSYCKLIFFIEFI
jgi:hypothetical protein